MRQLDPAHVVGEVPHDISVIVGFFRTGHLPLESLVGNMRTNEQRTERFAERAERIIADFSRRLRNCKSFMTDELETKGVDVFKETDVAL